MISVYDISVSGRAGILLWIILLCFLCLSDLVISIRAERIKYTVFSAALFLLSYYIFQVLTAIRLGKETAAFENLPVVLLLIILGIISALAVILLIRSLRYMRENITPVAIKLCADRMTCGICYFKNNGQVIFHNECMNRLSIALTGKTLMNGNMFYEAAFGDIRKIEGRAWNFTLNSHNLEGEPINELIAWDVTEINEKTESLKADNERLEVFREELKAYSLKIDDVVKQEEILQAKINIHDGMNRLMLRTVASESTDITDINDIFGMWEKSTELLGIQADEGTESAVLQKIEKLAEAIGIDIVWKGNCIDLLNQKQKELFVIAAQEALINAVKHAKAENILIYFDEHDDNIVCCFENSGIMPGKETGFNGGLANLAILAEAQDVGFSADWDDTFKLKLIFPK